MEARKVTAVLRLVLPASMPARSQCPAPASPVRVMFMNGTADPLLPYHGGHVGGGDRRGTVPSDRSQVELIRCMKDRLPVISLCLVGDGGQQNGDIEMAQEMWRFFSAR